MSLDDLPRHDDRTALGGGYVAVDGVPIGASPDDSPNIERWRNQVLLDSACARPQTN